jgi:hypothetical protein
MNGLLTILYLEANRAELERRATRSRHSESAHLRRERRTRRRV